MFANSKTTFAPNSKYNPTKRSQMNIITRSNEASKDKRPINSGQTKQADHRDENYITSRVFSNCRLGNNQKEYYSKYNMAPSDISNYQNIHNRNNLYRKISNVSKNDLSLNKTSENYFLDLEEGKENIRMHEDITLPKTQTIKLSDINCSNLGKNLALKGIIRGPNNAEKTTLTRQSTSITVDKFNQTTNKRGFEKNNKRSYLDYMKKSRATNITNPSFVNTKQRQNMTFNDEEDFQAKDFIQMKQTENISHNPQRSLPKSTNDLDDQEKAEVIKIKNLKLSDLNMSHKMPLNNMDQVNNLRKSFQTYNKQEIDRKQYSKSISKTNTLNTKFFAKKLGNFNMRNCETVTDRNPFEPLLKPNIKNINDYAFSKVIGKGSYAMVRQATHKKTKTVVAIKTYEKSKQCDPLKKAAVDREIKILQQLNHENIIGYVDCYYDKLQINLVLEFPGQRSLYEYVKSSSSKKIDEGECKLIFKQILTSVHYLHCLSIGHRDIKMENILYTKAGVIKLIDFGFAVQTKDKLRTYCGTPTYMAPELVKKTNYFGADVDKWALGVLLYRMLTGIYPFRASKDRELFKKITAGNYDTKLLSTPESINLIGKLLKINPSERADCKELLSHPWFQTEKQYKIDEFYKTTQN